MNAPLSSPLKGGSSRARVARGKKRHYSRYRLPVLLDIPALSEESMMPEDVSAGGFKLILAEQPELGAVLVCRLQIGPRLFGPYPSEVVWVRENEMDLSSCSIGVHMCMDEDERTRLDGALRDFPIHSS